MSQKKLLTKPVTRAEWNKVLDALDRSGVHVNSYYIEKLYPEKKSSNGEILSEVWEIWRNNRNNETEFSYVKLNFNDIPYECTYPYLERDVDILDMLNDKIKESVKNPNVKVYQINHEEKIDLDSLNYLGYSTRAPRKRAAPKKRTPCVKVNIRKMF